MLDGSKDVCSSKEVPLGVLGDSTQGNDAIVKLCPTGGFQDVYHRHIAKVSYSLSYNEANQFKKHQIIIA
jgi:hypothetical protein